MSKGWDLPVLQTAMGFILRHRFLEPPGVDWPVPNPSNEWDISGFFSSQFLHAAKAYQIWDKTDAVTLQWQEWMEKLENLK